MQYLQLQRTLKFTTEDLRANRDGHISDAQHEKYKPPEFSKLVLIVIFGHAAVIVGLLAAIALVSGKPAMWIVVGIVLVLGLLPFLLLNNEGNVNPTLRGDIKHGVVKKTCGIAIITEKKLRNRVVYELYINGVTLKLSATKAAAFINEQDYCVYYLPLSKTVLSAEPYQDE